MNTFQNLINECLIYTKHVESAAVLVYRSGVVCAVSSGFQIRSEEALMLADAFKHLARTKQQGLSLQGKLFTCIRADRKSIYCKCGGHGLILIRTSHHVVAATYNDSMYPSMCVEAVETLGDYLRLRGK